MALHFQFDFEVTKAALVYLAGKPLPFDKYRACKLLFLADRQHLLRFGRPITGDSYDALPFGPTPSETLTLMDGLESVLVEGKEPADVRVRELADLFTLVPHEYPRYFPKRSADIDVLSESDILILDEIAARYGNSGFSELVNLTHALRAYKSVWRDDAVRRKYPMHFEDFFAENPEKLDFLKELQEHQFLRSAMTTHRD